MSHGNLRVTRVAVVCGNPRAKSRTLEAAVFVARRLTETEPEVILDTVDIGPHLLGWGDPVASKPSSRSRRLGWRSSPVPPTRAAIPGLLKLFLDQIPTDGLSGLIAASVMLGAALGHAMAPDLLLKPVLVELGAACPARGLYLLETDYTSEAIIEPWAARARPFLPKS